MKTCQVCGELCEDSAEMCPKCGALAFLEEAEEGKAQAEIKKPVLVATLNDPVSAEIFGDMLKENGIAYVFGEENGAMHIGFGVSFIAIDVYVDEENLSKAQEILTEVLESEEDGDFSDEEQ